MTLQIYKSTPYSNTGYIYYTGNFTLTKRGDIPGGLAEPGMPQGMQVEHEIL